MYLSLFNHPQQVSSRQWLDDLQQLPYWRQEKALRYHFLIDRVLCTEAYLLLKRGLSAKFGVTRDFTFRYIGHDKPVLNEYPNIHFNLSHCKKGVLCVIDYQPVGCDIEEIEEELNPDLMKLCFNNQEIEQINSSPDPCVEFTRFWTIKEAVLKLTGDGISDQLPSLLSPRLMAGIEVQTVVRKDLGYVYSVCQFKKKRT